MFIYRILSILFYPAIELYLFYRVFKKKEDKHRLKERLGNASLPRPEGDLIWLHAVSVGEANSALILVEELLKFLPETSILFTTTTVTSASVIASKLPNFKGRVIHQYLPVDAYICVKNFLNFWQPCATIFIESEIWPNMVCESKKTGAPVFLVNARISQKTYNKWHFAKKIGFKIFNDFAVIFAQMKEDQERLQKLTNKEILFYGNLKSQAQVLAFNVNELEKLKSQINNRPFWLAASTHKGEEESVLAVHKELLKDYPNLLTVLVPRHPYRFEEIKLLLSGFNVAQRSKNESITSSTNFYVADTLGELGTFYSLADFAFIGGSLLEIGGHNPFEAIKLNCAVISGRGVFNFKEIYKNLEEQKSCIMVNSNSELTLAVKKLLQDKKYCKDISDKALDVIKDSDDITKNIVTRIVQEIAIDA
jgi:3-deoxy-D-manno-octulosonic-acid transferase